MHIPVHIFAYMCLCLAFIDIIAKDKQTTRNLQLWQIQMKYKGRPATVGLGYSLKVFVNMVFNKWPSMAGVPFNTPQRGY